MIFGGDLGGVDWERNHPYAPSKRRFGPRRLFFGVVGSRTAGDALMRWQETSKCCTNPQLEVKITICVLCYAGIGADLSYCRHTVCAFHVFDEILNDIGYTNNLTLQISSSAMFVIV